MAFDYQSFATLNVNLNRQSYGPLDISNVFTSENDLQYYLTKGAYTEGVSEYWYKNADEKIVPYPYEGQVLATVIDGVVTVRALALDAEGNFTAQEIGSTADGASIEAVDGKLTLKGFNAASEATIPQKQSDGSIAWVKISDVVSGDTNTTYDVVAADGSGITVNKVKAESGDHYTYTLDVTIPSAAYSITKAVGEGVTTYQLTKDGVAEGEAIVVPDVYDDTALAGRVKAAEDKFANYYDKAQVDGKIAALEGTTHFIGVKDALPDSANVGDVCIVGNKEHIFTEDGWVELGDTSAELERITALEAIDHEAYIAADATLKTELEGKINAKQDLIAENTFDAYGAAEQALEDATAYVDETKITDVTVTHSSDTAAEGATVDGNTINIVVDAYTKEETLQKIADKITEVNGGESAGEVLGQLNSYKETNDNRVGAIETSLGTEGSVTKAIAAAQKAGEDAGRAVETLSAGQVTTNKNDISAINTKIDQINENITAHQTSIGSLQQADTNLAGQIAGETSAREALAETVNANTSEITKLKSKDTELESLIQSNTDKFADYSTTAQVNKAIDDKIAAIDHSAMQDAIAANDAAIKAEVERATAAEKANGDLVAALVGEDAGKTARNIAKEEVAAIVGAAPEAMDTLEEVAAWIANDETGAAAMSTAISANTSALAILNGTGEGSVDKKIADAIAGIPQIPTATIERLGLVKASDTISVAADGTMNVAKVSTDLLVQGEKELVLSGGSAQ